MQIENFALSSHFKIFLQESSGTSSLEKIRIFNAFSQHEQRKVLIICNNNPEEWC